MLAVALGQDIRPDLLQSGYFVLPQEKFRDSPPGARPEGEPGFAVGDQPRDGRRDVGCVLIGRMRMNADTRGVVHRGRRPSDACHDGGQAVGHRFLNGEPPRFAVARKDENVRGTVEVVYPSSVHPAVETHSVTEPEVRR